MTHVRLMTAADLPLGMRLKEQAGWNQVEADWRRFLELEPQGCFVAEVDGRPVGTTTTCIFGPVAWVAAVLVDESLRGQGVGRALMEHALAFLDATGVRIVRLDATPMGRPLYEKLGFALEYTLGRFDGVLPSVPANETGAEAISASDFETVLQIDHAATGTDRRKLLRQLFDEHPNEARVWKSAGQVAGYSTTRPGSKAWMIGPCVGTTDAGPPLLADACRRHAGRRVFVDIPMENVAAVRLAERLGLTTQRPLYRMTRGPLVGEKPVAIWASSGPEKG